MQANPKIKAIEIDVLYDSLVAQMNQHMGSMKVKLQEQRNAEEQEKLRQIQMKVEAERKAKEAEEQKIREEEETRRKKVKEKIFFVHSKIRQNFLRFRPRSKRVASRRKSNVCDSRRKTGKQL